MIYKSEKEIKDILEGGALLGKVMDVLIEKAVAGVATAELDKIAYDLITSYGGRPSFLHYKPSFADKPFPATLCTSVNDGVVHTPATLDYTLKTGDVLKIDVGMEYKGMYTDMARTIGIGKISRDAKILLSATQQALDDAIASLEVGQSLYSIGPAVEKVADEFELGIVRDLVGHGVGKAIHEEPNIPNYTSKHLKSAIIKPGMCVAIEPMLTLGTDDIAMSPDEWTYCTADGSLAAQFENTVVCDYDGVIKVATPTQWHFK